MVMSRAALSSLFQHTAITAGVTVRVAVNFMPEQSRVGAGRWFWVYHIRIENGRDETVQLKSRRWSITDARGRTEEVRGPGVVGQTPVIPPGQSFTYTSGCPLPTPSGIMVGSYQMTGETGELFDVAIPAFSLDSPYTVRSVN